MQQNNPYNPQPQFQQPPMLGMMPPQRPVKKNWRERLFEGTSGRPLTLQQERTMPNWLVGKSVVFFFIAFVACTFAFGYPMELRYAIVSSLYVILFFYGSKSAINGAVHTSEKAFVKNVFIVGLAARLAWAMYCYFFFNPDYYGTPWGDSADVEWYMPFGEAIAGWIRGESTSSFGKLMADWNASIDDVGYPLWLAAVNIFCFGTSDVFIPFIVKCVVGGYCAVCIYHVSKRHFGEGAARIGAMFVALNPNIIYWCGTMMKEAEMVFLVCLAVDNFDRVLTSGSKFTFKNLLPGMSAAIALMFFRSVLGIVMFLAVFAHIIMASQRVMSIGKKVLAGLLVGAVLAVSMGDRIRMQSQELLSKAHSENQRINMEWRGEREGGNSFAKYAGAAVFAPLIFTIPFPTFNQAQEGQILQIQLAGGSYIKNIFSFFVIIVMLILLISGEWRRHVFIIAYTMGYLIVLIMSPFAQSGRFHMPVIPVLMLFAAYGIQIAKTNGRMKRWFSMVLVAEVLVCLAWNWFKLKGRGMI